jgi:hypothetical protein
MVTNYPQPIGVGRAIVERTKQEFDAAMGALWTRAGQLLCGLHGHDQVLRFANRRIRLLCTSCGHESPGWETGTQPPRLRFAGDARRHRLNTSAPTRRPGPRPLEIRRTA